QRPRQQLQEVRQPRTAGGEVMEPDTRTLHPVAFAVHTRDREDDYRWYCAGGEADLLDRLKDVYQGVLADQEAKPATFALLDGGERVAVLVANLKTSRSDHVRTRIDDALFL